MTEMGVKRVRKRPVEVEAARLTEESRDHVLAWVRLGDGAARRDDIGLMIVTLEGLMAVPYGHWVIRGVKGEFYGCDPAVFDATYDVLEGE